MNRSLLFRGVRSAAIVMVVAAVAIFIFGSAKFTAMLLDGHFWTTLGAAGIGGFIGGMVQKERKAKSS